MFENISKKQEKVQEKIQKQQERNDDKNRELTDEELEQLTGGGLGPSAAQLQLVAQGVQVAQFQGVQATYVVSGAPAAGIGKGEKL